MRLIKLTWSELEVLKTDNTFKRVEYINDHGLPDALACTGVGSSMRYFSCEFEHVHGSALLTTFTLTAFKHVKPPRKTKRQARK